MYGESVSEAVAAAPWGQLQEAFFLLPFLVAETLD